MSFLQKIKKHWVSTLVVIIIVVSGGYWWYTTHQSSMGTTSYVTAAAATQPLIVSDADSHGDSPALLVCGLTRWEDMPGWAEKNKSQRKHLRSTLNRQCREKVVYADGLIKQVLTSKSMTFPPVGFRLKAENEKEIEDGEKMDETAS